LGNAASDILMACMHTHLCAKMLNQKVKNVGVVASTFKINEFIDALREKSTVDGEYSYLAAVRNFALMTGDISNSAPVSMSLFGTMDKDDLIKAAEPVPLPPVKEPKPRAQRTKNDEANATQTEILKKQKPSEAVADDTPEGLADDIVKMVKSKFKHNGNVPLNMLEVAAEGAEDFHSMMTRLLGIAFVVRDGRFEMKREDGAGLEENLSSLTLKPEKQPAKNNTTQPEGEHQAARSQTIVSFPASALKNLFNASST